MSKILVYGATGGQDAAVSQLFKVDTADWNFASRRAGEFTASLPA